jgi:hypothetical protein
MRWECVSGHLPAMKPPVYQQVETWLARQIPLQVNRIRKRRYFAPRSFTIHQKEGNPAWSKPPSLQEAKRCFFNALALIPVGDGLCS